MQPVLLEVLAPMLSSVEMDCRSCRLMFETLGLRRGHQRTCTNEYPSDWKQASVDLSTWIREIARLYRHRILIRLIDAQSPLGLWKQIRYRLFRFPAFIVDKQKTYVGWDPPRLEALIDARIHAPA